MGTRSTRVFRAYTSTGLTRYGRAITYIRMSKGLCICGGHGLVQLVCALLVSIQYGGCPLRLEALRTLMKSTPEIFNTDQGSQYTSMAFTGN